MKAKSKSLLPGYRVRVFDGNHLAAWLREAGCAVAFTGAGISTESGIPDFRSPGGVWSKTQAVLYDDFVASAEARREYWRQSPAPTRIVRRFRTIPVS